MTRYASAVEKIAEKIVNKSLAIRGRSHETSGTLETIAASAIAAGVAPLVDLVRALAPIWHERANGHYGLFSFCSLDSCTAYRTLLSRWTAPASADAQKGK